MILNNKKYKKYKIKYKKKLKKLKIKIRGISAGNSLPFTLAAATLRSVARRDNHTAPIS
jgi:hypothetical protein